MSKVSASDLVLQAASLLTTNGKPHFTTPDLVVAAWEHSPDDFGLSGKIDTHPDSTKVLSVIGGKSGLTTLGYLERDELRRYRLTDKGRCRVNEVFNQPDPDANRLTEAQEKILLHLLSTKAYAKVDSGRRDDVFKSEVETFYGIVGSEVDEAVASTNKILNDIECKLDTAREIKAGDHTITGGTIRFLRNIGDMILDKHKKYFDMLRSEAKIPA